MGELTNERPKPMLLVQGKPILQHIIEGIRDAGIRDIFVVTGYRAEMIENHFQDGSPFKVHVTYGTQTVQDGTGKAPEVAQTFIGSDDFLLTYGDILVKPENYIRMLDRFRDAAANANPRSKPAGLVTVTAGEDVTKGGINLFDSDFYLTELVEKPTPQQLGDLRARGLLKPGDPVWYNAGIYIFSPILFEFTAKLQKSPRGEYELTDALNAMVRSGHKIAGLRIDGRWVDVRDPGVLASLHRNS